MLTVVRNVIGLIHHLAHHELLIRVVHNLLLRVHLGLNRGLHLLVYGCLMLLRFALWHGLLTELPDPLFVAQIRGEQQLQKTLAHAYLAAEGHQRSLCLIQARPVMQLLHSEHVLSV